MLKTDEASFRACGPRGSRNLSAEGLRPSGFVTSECRLLREGDGPTGGPGKANLFDPSLHLLMSRLETARCRRHAVQLGEKESI